MERLAKIILKLAKEYYNFWKKCKKYIDINKILQYSINIKKNSPAPGRYGSKEFMMTKTQVVVRVINVIEGVNFVNVKPNLIRIINIIENDRGDTIADVEIHNTRTGNWACFFVNVDRGYIFYSPEEDEEE